MFKVNDIVKFHYYQPEHIWYIVRITDIKDYNNQYKKVSYTGNTLYTNAKQGCINNAGFSYYDKAENGAKYLIAYRLKEWLKND